MLDLNAARRDVGVFAEHVGRPLTDWQADAARLPARIAVWVAPRQSGKSRTLAVLALHRAFTQAGARVLIVSAGEDASRRLLADVRAIASGSPLLRGSVVDEQAALLTLSNGSEIRSVPASERQVRGWSVDLLLCDEAALIADDLLLGAALPTTAARPDARVVLASSPLSAVGAFYDFALRGEGGSEHVRTFRWRLSDAAWIAPSVIAAARESMSDVRFRCEYEAEFASGADAVFTRAALDRATVDYATAPLASLTAPARLLGGIDWGERADRTALVAVGRIAGTERFGVACAERWRAGAPLPGVVAEIAASPAAFHVLAAESNGLGGPCCQMLFAAIKDRPAPLGGGRPVRGSMLMDEDDLDRRLARRRDRVVLPGPAGAPPVARPFRSALHRVYTSGELKAFVWSAIRVLIERELLVLPASATDLLRELALLRVNLTPSGAERIEARGTAADDLADALATAAYGYDTRARGARACYLADLADLPRPPAPQLPDGFDFGPPAHGAADVPRSPVWQSICGREVTVPAPLTRRDPHQEFWDQRRARSLDLRPVNRP